jgi:hypothetical protein
MEVRPSSADSGPIKVDEVAKGWQRVVNRHSILRTFFQAGPQSKKLYQIVLKDLNTPISYITPTAPDPVNPFDLLPEMPEDGTPPHRLVLAQTSSGTVLLQLQVSHAIYDAISLMGCVCFGFMLSGRDASTPEVNSVLGLLINLMPCMVKPGQETSLSIMFQDLQADFAEVLMVCCSWIPA